MPFFFRDIANHYQRFTASGTWTRPTGVNAVFVRIQGAGGGAGGGQGSSGVGDDPGGGGAGGGSGQLVEDYVAISGDVTVTVGTGGPGGAGGAGGGVGTGGTPGTAGGLSQFGALTAQGGNGGDGGVLSTDAAGGLPVPTATPGSTGVASDNLPIQIFGVRGHGGLQGGRGARIGTTNNCAGSTSALFVGGAAGSAGAAPAIGTGAGGGASTNYGIGGAGGNGGNNTDFPGFPGQDGQGYGTGGGGGGGAATFSVGGAQSGGDGGAGADGVVEVWWIEESAGQDIICGPGGGTISLPPVNICQGQENDIALNISDFGSFAGPVTLSASGLPTGVTAVFTPNPATGAFVLTLSASVVSSLGMTTTITITATDGVTSVDGDMDITVIDCGGPNPGVDTGACWQLFRLKWLQDPEPMDLVHYESQETNHGYYGFHFDRDGYLELRSSAVVALTVVIDGVIQAPSYTILSTGDARSKVYIPMRANKGKYYRYLLDSAESFHVYNFRVRSKGWGAGPFRDVTPLTGTESAADFDSLRDADPRMF